MFVQHSTLLKYLQFSFVIYAFLTCNSFVNIL